MGVISKEGLVRRMAEKTGEGLAKTHNTVEAFLEVFQGVLTEGHDLRIHNFGTMKLTRKPKRVVRNPSNGTTITVGPKTVVKFTPSGKLKDDLAPVIPLD